MQPPSVLLRSIARLPCFIKDLVWEFSYLNYDSVCPVYRRTGDIFGIKIWGIIWSVMLQSVTFLCIQFCWRCSISRTYPCYLLTCSHYYVVVYLFFDEICRRSLTFLNKCRLFSDVEAVRSVAHYAVLYWRNHSPLGRNLLFCMSRYNCTAPDISTIFWLITTTYCQYYSIEECSTLC